MIRKRVTFSGILRSEGQEAECAILATEVTLPGSTASALCEYSVQKVTKILPEGRYQLHARGEIINLRHHQGHWLADS
jgi:hypothetical protein